SARPFRGGNRVLEQHRNGHGTHASRDWGDEGSLGCNSFEIDIPGDPAIGQAVDADIDDHRAGLDHLGQDQPRPAGRHNENIGEYGELRQIARLCMTDAYRRIPLHQHQGHWLADDVAGPNHDDVLAFDFDPLVLEQLDDSVGRTGRKNGVADYESADVVQVKAIDIFLDRDGLEHTSHVNVWWQGQLHQN